MDAARVAVYTSALAYLPAATITQLTSDTAPAVRTTAVSTADHQAVVRATDNVVVVAFRGTDNARNWIANFKFIPAPTDLGMVHAGFRDGYEAVAPRIREIVRAERIRAQPVWLTGHSLGGAMAMIAASDFRKMNVEPAGVVTFGQPPAGYRAFTEAWEAKAPGRLVRYVNHVDAVAGLTGPIAWPSMALTHTGRVRYFDTSGRLHDISMPAIQGLRDSVCAPAFESGAEFGAHYIRRYVTLVRLAAGR
jgi:pimeloyl-ACP methyl ester carboxylesterase